ncbi:hypothetical protein [Geoalkalibacter halelectricus]|uniref:hypothetical protein n=1 Tax=Geoalkalibacter halelectricus TaxID=2847045 RepID=UPI00266EF124|nr:hypothetical protein [Geoalkalibacter halelectricus]
MDVKIRPYLSQFYSKKRTNHQGLVFINFFEKPYTLTQEGVKNSDKSPHIPYFDKHGKTCLNYKRKLNNPEPHNPLRVN